MRMHEFFLYVIVCIFLIVFLGTAVLTSGCDGDDEALKVGIWRESSGVLLARAIRQSDGGQDASINPDICNEADKMYVSSAIADCWWAGLKDKCLITHGITKPCAMRLIQFIECAQKQCIKPCAAGELEECILCRKQCQKELWGFTFPLE